MTKQIKVCPTCEREHCRNRWSSKGIKTIPDEGWEESDLEPDGTRARQGDTLVAIDYSGTGEGIHHEDDVFEGAEYDCLGIYECNGPCVYVAAESWGNLGMSQCHFRIKKRRKYDSRKSTKVH
jgi:hypothetical protein